jgi:hypothetical protein
MAEKNGVYVYAPDAEDLSNTGLVGDLKPIEAVFTEEKNGVCQVKIKLPYDKLERWKAAAVGNYIKCLVPVRVPPVIHDDEYANTVRVGEVT